MQRLYTLLVLACLLSTGLRAQSAEEFDYDAGSTLMGLDGGVGWLDAWQTLKGNDQSATADGNITVAGYGSSGTNHLAITHNAGDAGIRAFRLLASPVTDDAPGTYYMSWWQDADFDPANPGGSVAQAIITRSVAFGSGGPGGQLVRMGKIFGSEEFGVDGANGLGAQRIAGTNTNEAFFAVAKITMSGNGDVDTVRIFLNPDQAATELVDADADMTRTPNLNNGFDAFGFKVEGGSTLSSAFDRFRFSTELGQALGRDDIGEAFSLNVDQFNDYDAGEELNDQDGGLGWGGDWVRVSGDPSVVLEGGVDNFTTLLGTSGNRVRSQWTNTMGDTRFYRLLNAPVQDNGDDYYFSYNSVSEYQNRGGSANFFMFIDSDTYQASGPGGQLAQIGKPQNTPFIGTGVGGTNNFELTGASAEDAHLVVIKLSTSGNADVDTVRIYIDPVPGDPEPAVADATKLFSGRLDNGFDAIGFKVTGAAGAAMEFDDVMAGTSYASVFPDDFEVLEPLSNALAVETFNSYAGGTDLEGLNDGQGWSGPWEALGTLDSTTIRGQGLLNDDLLAATTGSSSRTISTGVTEQAIRYFSSPLDTTDNASFWFSTHLAASGNVAGSVGNIILIDSTFGADQNRVIVGKQFGNRNLFVTGVGAGNTQTGEQLPDGNAQFVVGHMVRENGQWLLDVWVNPDPAGTEPAEADANVMNKVYNAGNFDGVSIRTAGTGVGLQWDVDDIYIGAEWGDVIPVELNTISAAPPGATESFEYAVDGSVVGGDGGTGWTGPWQLVALDDASNVEDNGVASVPLLQQTGAPGARMNAYHRLMRGLEGTYGDVGRDFWLGWWMDVDMAGSNVVQFALVDTTVFATGTGGEVVQIGNKFNGGTLGIVPGGNIAGATSEDGHFFVAHVITNGSADNDEVIVWLDPDLDAIPSADTADVRTTTDLTNWNGIGLKFEGNDGQPTTVLFDEIRVAGTYDEVIPTNLMDIAPPDAPQPAYEPFDYAAGQMLNGAEGGEGWAGPWETVAGTTLIASGSLMSDRSCEEFNQASIDQMGAGTPTQVRRDFFNPFGTTAASATFYSSFQMNIDAKDIGNQGLFRFIDANGDPVLSVGGVAGVEALAAFPGAENPSTTNAINAAGTKWFVVRMDVDVMAGTADARIWVDPQPDAIPGDNSATFTFENVDVQNGIAGVDVLGSGAQSVSLLFDDIRAGFSFRDVACNFGSDDPNLLAYEPFNYDVGQPLHEAGGINAFWDGPWTQEFANDNNTAVMIDGSVMYDGIDVIGNQVQMDFNTPLEQLNYSRPLAQTVESDGSTYYLTFFQNTVTPDATDNIGNITLTTSEIDNRQGRLLAVGRAFGQGTLGTVIVQNNNVRRTDVADEGLNWIVLQIKTTGDDAPVDTVTMWINPPVGPEPDTFSTGFVQQFNSPSFKQGFDGVQVRAEGSGANQAPYVTGFDEIRIASSWGSARVTNTIEVAPNDPFQLTAFPNPATTNITIAYDLERAGKVNVELFNLNGQRVMTLYNGERPAGEQQLTLNIGRGSRMPNGIYLMRVTQNGKSTTRKLMIQR